MDHMIYCKCGEYLGLTTEEICEKCKLKTKIKQLKGALKELNGDIILLEVQGKIPLSISTDFQERIKKALEE